MPEYPEKKTTTTSKAHSFVLGAGIPIVRSISGYFLQYEGWHHEKGNNYTKDGNTLNYDGVYWTLNGSKRIEFMEELNQEIKKNNDNNSK